MKYLACALLLALSQTALADTVRYNLTITNAAGDGHFQPIWCDFPMCEDGLTGAKLAVDHSLVNEIKFNVLPVVAALQFADGTVTPTSGACRFNGDNLDCQVTYYGAVLELGLDLSAKSNAAKVQLDTEYHGPVTTRGLATWKRVAPPKPKSDTKPKSSTGNLPPSS